MSTLATKLKHELHELIPVTVFFFVALQLLAITEALILRQYGIRVSTFVAAAIGALVVAKVVVIADHVPLVNRFPHKPLIYNVLWKSTIYFVVSLAVRYVEHFIHFWQRSATAAEANRRLWDEIVWPHFWIVQVWLVILLLTYSALRELVRVLGRDKIVGMFFGTPDRPGSSPSPGLAPTHVPHP